MNLLSKPDRRFPLPPRLAIVGASSHIAGDFICHAAEYGYKLLLYARNHIALDKYLKQRIPYSSYEVLNIQEIENISQSVGVSAIMNFVGTSDPKKIRNFSNDYLKQIDNIDQVLVNQLEELKDVPYIFLSSGCVYDHDFNTPATTLTKIRSTNLDDSIYIQSKTLSENRHRQYLDLPIIDLRIFSYFSSTQDLESGFLMSEIAKSILNQQLLRTSSQNIVRDYIHSTDLFSLVQCILGTKIKNQGLDAYSKSSIDKFRLLEILHSEFNLQYEFDTQIQSTVRPIYFTENYLAEELGYNPFLSSIDSITIELSKILHAH